MDEGPPSDDELVETEVCPECGGRMLPARPCGCDDPDAIPLQFCEDCGNTLKLRRATEVP